MESRIKKLYATLQSLKAIKKFANFKIKIYNFTLKMRKMWLKNALKIP